jgi:hypothetical protein
MKKTLYYELSDNCDVTKLVSHLQGIMDFIEADMFDITEEDDRREYTINPVWLTDEEYSKLPEFEV